MNRKITLSHTKTRRKIWLRNAVQNTGEWKAEDKRYRKGVGRGEVLQRG